MLFCVINIKTSFNVIIIMKETYIVSLQWILLIYYYYQLKPHYNWRENPQNYSFSSLPKSICCIEKMNPAWLCCYNYDSWHHTSLSFLLSHHKTVSVHSKLQLVPPTHVAAHFYIRRWQGESYFCYHMLPNQHQA